MSAHLPCHRVIDAIFPAHKWTENKAAEAASQIRPISVQILACPHDPKFSEFTVLILKWHTV
jgi:hypothetical protein